MASLADEHAPDGHADGTTSAHDHHPHAPSHTPQESRSHTPMPQPLDLHSFSKHLHRHGHGYSHPRLPKSLGLHVQLRWKERIKHFTFTWFTLNMATAGVANSLHHIPFQFHGLYAIGCTFFILNLVLFIFNCSMMGLRFYWWPSTFKAAFLHPTESLFIPAFVISIASIAVNIAEYGLGSGKAGVWLLDTLSVLFWVYVVMAFSSSVGIYLTMWSTQTFTLANMTPIWIFPAYPLLLVGPLAAALSAAQGARGDRALQMIVGGIMCQGTGFMVSLMIYAAFIYRLMAHKLPAESTRPGMFTSIGPSAFTVSSVIGMGLHFETVVSAGFMGDGALAGRVTKVLAIWAGVWLYGLALWFFFVSAFAHWSCVGGNRLTFAVTWYSFVFPNSALVTATFNVALALDLYPMQVVGCVMAGALVVVWAAIVFMNVRAVVLKQILWPQKQEDSDEHIWKQAESRQQHHSWLRLLRHHHHHHHGGGHHHHRHHMPPDLDTAASVSQVPSHAPNSCVNTPVRPQRVSDLQAQAHAHAAAAV